MSQVYADTSFLISLYGSDVHSVSARKRVSKLRTPIAVTALGIFEFGNALRFAAFRKLISPREVAGSIAAFDNDLKLGLLSLRARELHEIIAAANELSQKHTISGGHRSFDVLHVASALVLRSAEFLTFAANQRILAAAVGLRLEI